MIYLVLTYLLFQLAFDHWAQDNAVWWGVFYFVQWGVVAGVCLIEFYRSRRAWWILLSLPFLGLAADEILMMATASQPLQMAAAPALNLTIFAGIIFIIFEILTKWKKRSV